MRKKTPDKRKRGVVSHRDFYKQYVDRAAIPPAGPVLELIPGPDQVSPSHDELLSRVALMERTARRYLPDMVKAVHESKAEGAMLLLHQDSFAVDYQVDEYTLLALTIKYAGLHGVPVQIMGVNRETLDSCRTDT